MLYTEYATHGERLSIVNTRENRSRSVGLLVATHVAAVVVGALLQWQMSKVLFKSDAAIPERPQTVPANAVWVGGADGGDWISCVVQQQHELRCAIYADTTGVLAEEGIYALDTAHLLSRYDQLDQFESYSSNGIYLRRPRLVRVDVREPD